MCFVLTNRTRKIADKDIVCWKALEKTGKNTFYSPYLDFSYKKNEVYTHKRFGWENKPSGWENKPRVINKGFHSFKEKSSAKNMSIGSIWSNTYQKFIIPKGTAYYENDTEYVSLRIKMIGGK